MQKYKTIPHYPVFFNGYQLFKQPSPRSMYFYSFAPSMEENVGIYDSEVLTDWRQNFALSSW